MNHVVVEYILVGVVVLIFATILIVDKISERRDCSVVRRVRSSRQKHRDCSWRKRYNQEDYVSPKNDGNFVPVPMIGRVVELPDGKKFVVYPRMMPDHPKK